MSDNATAKFVSVLKEQQSEIARGAMLRPNLDTYGIQAGIYQGIQYALDTLDNISRDTYEKEKHS